MKKSLFIVALALGTLAFSSCASKKDLENCRTENNQLTADYQNAKETIAANNARIKSWRISWLRRERVLLRCRVVLITV